MAIKYKDLIEREGTIYEKTTGKGFKTPADLATSMNILPHQIDWSKIAKEQVATKPPTATKPMPVQYTELTEKNGTIYKGGKGYASPSELAADLGILPHQIDWSKISKEQVPAKIKEPAAIKEPVLRTPLTDSQTQPPVETKEKPVKDIFKQPFAGLFQDPTGTVWQVGSGQRKGITSRQALEDWFPDQPLQQITMEDAARLPIVGYLNVGKTESVIAPPAVKKEAFEAEVKPTYDMDRLTAKAELSPEAMRAIEEGELVRPIGRPEIYQYSEEELRHIVSPEVFERLNFKWEDVRDVAPSLIAQYEKGVPLDIEGLSQQALPSYTSALKSYDEAFEAAKTSELAEFKKKEESWLGKYITAITGREPSAEMYKKEAELAGLPGISEQLVSLNKLIAEKETAAKMAIESALGILESTGFISRQQNIIRTAADIALSGLYAKKSAIQGEYEMAYDQARLASNLAIQDQIDRIDGIGAVLNLYSAQASDEEKKVIDEMNWDLAVQKDKVNRERRLEDEKIAIFLEYGTRYPQAGVDIRDSYETIINKIEPYATKEEKMRMAQDVIDIGGFVTYEEAGLTSATGKLGGTRTWRTNNPLAIRYGDFAKSQGAVDTDGILAIFNTEAEGWAAAKNLLQGPSYNNLTINDALSRWSGREYDGSIMQGTGLDPQMVINTLDDEQLGVVMNTIQSKEGWGEGTFTSEQVGAAKQAITLGQILGLDKSTAAKFDVDIEEEMENIYEKGMYRREQSLDNLQGKYPGLRDILPEIIYGSERFGDGIFPDGYENRVQVPFLVRYTDDKLNDILTGFMGVTENDKNAVRNMIHTGVFDNYETDKKGEIVYDDDDIPIVEETIELTNEERWRLFDLLEMYKVPEEPVEERKDIKWIPRWLEDLIYD